MAFRSCAVTFIAACVLALGAQAGLAQSRAGGLDPARDALDRRERLLGWEAVGRLEVPGEGYCTGVLIATDLVLTAAHCLYGATGQPHDPAEMVFRAGLMHGAAVAEARAARMVAHPAYRPLGGTNLQNIRHDIAVVQLRDPVAAAVAAPFSVQGAPSARVVSVVSYARGRDDVPSWQRDCTLTGQQQGLMAIDCDVTFGASGAPVFDLSRGRGRIAGLISSGGEMNGRPVALAMTLPAALGAVQRALQTGDGVILASDLARGGARRITGVSGISRNSEITARFVPAKGVD